MLEMICRGKRKDNGEWVEGYLFKKYFQDPPHDRFVIQYKTKYNPEVLWQPDYMAEEVIFETVGWFTGLYDSTKWEHLTVKEKDEFMSYGNLPNEWKGKKIFVGHVLEVGTVRGIVEWSEKEAAFMFRWKNFDRHRKDFFKSCILTHFGRFDKLEVIGNIHDNPELLKEEVI